MAKTIDFSRATPLKEYYNHNLLENYNYKNESDNFIFNEILLHFRICRVDKIYNPQLYGMYLLSKKELLTSNPNYQVEEKILYHATSSENANKISKNNIDWRLTSRSRFGKGSCFSPSPIYANRHSSLGGAFVVFKVLVQRIEDIDYVCYDLRIPHDNIYDTTCSNDGNVYVKYDDNYFYPQYIVYYI